MLIEHLVGSNKNMKIEGLSDYMTSSLSRSDSLEPEQETGSHASHFHIRSKTQ